MKRRITIILLLLIGGAIVNIAVAWGCCAYTRPKAADSSEAASINMEQLLVYLPEEVHELLRSRDQFKFREDDPRVFFIRRSGGEVHTCWTAQYSYRYPAFLGLGEATWAGPAIRFDECRAGWPRSSLQSMKIEATSSRFAHTSSISDESLTPLKSHFNEYHLKDGLQFLRIAPGTRLPYKIMWQGFLLNSAFYALVLGVAVYLASLPFAARRMNRRRRGLCERCAYPVGVSPVCTECGAAASRPRKAKA